jgi:hypothetical protein
VTDLAKFTPPAPPRFPRRSRSPESAVTFGGIRTRRAVTQEEVLAQMEKRHKKRLASIRAHYAKQGIELLE